MIQPYTPPPYPRYPANPYPPFGGNALTPARRTSVLMFVLAVLMLLMAGCLGGFARVPFESLPDDQRAEIQRLDSTLRTQTGHGLKEGLLVACVQLVVPALLLGVLGFGVRAGRRGWIVTSIVIASLLLALVVLQMLVAFVQVARDPTLIFAAIMWAVPVGLFVLLVTWLVGSYRSIRRAALVPPPAGFPEQWPAPPGYPPYGQQVPPTSYGYGYGPPPPTAPLPPVDDPRARS